VIACLQSSYSQYAISQALSSDGQLRVAEGKISYTTTLPPTVFKDLLGTYSSLQDLARSVSPDFIVILKPRQNIFQVEYILSSVGSPEDQTIFKKIIRAAIDAKEGGSLTPLMEECFQCSEEFDISLGSTECLRLAGCGCVVHIECARRWYTQQTESGGMVPLHCIVCSSRTPLAIDDLGLIMGEQFSSFLQPRAQNLFEARNRALWVSCPSGGIRCRMMFKKRTQNERFCGVSCPGCNFSFCVACAGEGRIR
jgi:hypothetical protein